VLQVVEEQIIISFFPWHIYLSFIPSFGYEFYVPTFRNALFHLHRPWKQEETAFRNIDI
jgi:hypothetical protein